MIDHQAAVDLWERYKRGERNVFTRRLYTLQGQQAFDEVRRKYRADAEFRDTVDRYITEFDRLLEQVSADDRNHVLTKTYLTSDTGKVYTMLAHAAAATSDADGPPSGGPFPATGRDHTAKHPPLMKRRVFLHSGQKGRVRSGKTTTSPRR